MAFGKRRRFIQMAANASPAEQFGQIIDDQKKRRHQNQGDQGGEKDAKAQRDGNGDHLTGLDGLFHDHGHQSSESGQGGQNNGPETLKGSGINSLCGRNAGVDAAVHPVNQHQRIVDHDPGKCHHPEKTDHGKGIAEQQMPQNSPDHAERDTGHDDQRLDIAL